MTGATSLDIFRDARAVALPCPGDGVARALTEAYAVPEALPADMVALLARLNATPRVRS